MGVFEKIAPKEDYVPKVGSTQQHIPIKDIHDDVVFLKDGGMALILQTSAVNFDLLSENEQIAIISAFAGLLNSLSFSIQIIVRSKRLDISQYVESIKNMENKQTNQLLKTMTGRYRVFVENLIRENEVLDKQFYVVISLSPYEVGVTADLEKKDLHKALNIIIPRRDHIIHQLARIGLKGVQLDNEKLIKLFYDIYNESFAEQDIRAFIDQHVLAQNNTPPAAPPSLNALSENDLPKFSNNPPRPVVKPIPQKEETPPPPQTTQLGNSVQEPVTPPKQPELPPNIPPFNFTDIEMYPHQTTQPEASPSQSQNQEFMGPFTQLFNQSSPLYKVEETSDNSNEDPASHRPQVPFMAQEVGE